jgi:hypothetical protein
MKRTRDSFESGGINDPRAYAQKTPGSVWINKEYYIHSFNLSEDELLILIEQWKSRIVPLFERLLLDGRINMTASELMDVYQDYWDSISLFTCRAGILENNKLHTETIVRDVMERVRHRYRMQPRYAERVALFVSLRSHVHQRDVRELLTRHLACIQTVQEDIMSPHDHVMVSFARKWFLRQ